jgi:hypothetical protein
VSETGDNSSGKALAGLIGLINSFRMMRLPEPTPSTSIEGMVLG